MAINSSGTNTRPATAIAPAIVHEHRRHVWKRDDRLPNGAELGAPDDGRGQRGEGNREHGDRNRREWHRTQAVGRIRGRHEFLDVGSERDRLLGVGEGPRRFRRRRFFFRRDLDSRERMVGELP
jgi:hypothetical protein